jgi:ABC-type multidrug transport system ATPase subunit
MLELQQGRGITYFRGRPLYRIAHPSREVGVLLGDVPGHPARSVRGHLRMLCAAAGVPARRADEVLEVVGIVSLRDERLGSLARGMDRRLGLACALLSDPHTLVLDEPADALSARESRWLYGMLRAHAAQGGTVLFTTADPKEAARSADRVVTLEQGRLVADQDAGDFARTRLRPRVAVRSPHANRLAALLTKEARTAHRSVEVVREDGNRLSVYGSTCADVGETAFRHDILVHQLADEIGDMGPGAGTTLRSEAEVVDEPRVPDTSSTAELPSARADASLAELPTRLADAPLAEMPPPCTVPLPAEAPPHSTDPLPGETPTPSTGTLPAETAQPHIAAPLAHSPQPLTAPLPVAEEPAPAAAPHPPYETHTATASPATTTSRLVPLIDPEKSAGTHPRARASRPSQALTLDTLPPLPPPISVRSAPSPLRPLRYELRRAAGIGTGFLTGAAVLVVSALTALLLARIGHTPQPRLLAAWPRELPLPPAALGAGLLGAFAFGDEFRHPALAADRGTVPRRMGLLVAKLLVSAATALLLAFLTVGCDAEVLYLVYGRELAQVPADWLLMSASWLGLVVGCAWAGVLAAGIFRSTTAGLAAVVAVPILVVPLVHKALDGPAVRTAEGFPLRLRKVLLLQWPFGGERYLSAAARVIAQPVGGALTLSLTALLCAYLLTTLRSRVR